MDATNLATLFAPNILHTFADDSVLLGAGSKSKAASVGGFAPAAIKGTAQGSAAGKAGQAVPERMEYVSAVRLLIDKRESIFELSVEELHEVYVSMHDGCPDVLDALLRRRAAMMGLE